MPNRNAAFLERLGLRVPIIQAPMAGVSSHTMAAAVANAGGLGSLGLGSGDVEAGRKALQAARAGTSGPINANLFCHRPATAHPDREAAWLETLSEEFRRYDAKQPRHLREIYQSFVTDAAMLDMLLAEKPHIVSFHFGLPPSGAIAALKETGIVLLASATNVGEAHLIAEAGIDAIVAQGWEAGGHRGQFNPDAPDDRLGTFALVRLLASRFDLPVIAAGGIMDGAGIAAALKLGAVAAQLGTAFIAADESLADQGYRATLASDGANHTVMTRAISGRPARCLANRFTALGQRTADSAIPDYPIAYDAGKALHAAAKGKGEYGYGAQWAGQGAPLARAGSTADLMARLIAEWQEHGG